MTKLLYVVVVNIILTLAIFALGSANGAPVQHQCIHDELLKREGYWKHKIASEGLQLVNSTNDNDNMKKEVRNVQSSTGWANLRLYLNTDLLQAGADGPYVCNSASDQFLYISGSSQQYIQCTAADVLTTDLRNYLINYIIQNASTILQETLMVQPVVGNLVLRQSQGTVCGFQGGVQVPANYFTTGLANTDLVIFVTARPIPGGQVLAFAGECQDDPTTNRPLAGHLNFSPAALSTNPSDFISQLGTALHETSHVLGFSSSKFTQYWTGSSTYSATTTITHTATATGASITQTAIGSPNVVAWVQDYFQCDTLTGALLENGGASGTQGSHWEKRTFMNEYMTGSSTHNPAFSTLTLATFEDSGWYQINTTKHTDRLMWGRGKGCSFVLESCKTVWDSNYWCDNARANQQCTADRFAKGYCALITYTSAIDPNYRYFSDPTEGGASDLADYCPYYLTTSDGDWCNDPTNSAGSGLIDSGEQYCTDCRCFSSSLLKHSPLSNVMAPKCYQTYCLSPTKLKVKVDSVWYDCPSGRSIKIEGYGGRIVCPQAEDVCGGSPIDTEWPTFVSITPSKGSPSTPVTIYGTGFTSPLSVSIGNNPCDQVVVVNANMTTAQVANSDQFTNPSHLLEQVVDVIIQDSQGRTAVGPGSFALKVTFGAAYVVASLKWMGNHLGITLGVAAALALCIIVCCWCCFKRNKKDFDDE